MATEPPTAAMSFPSMQSATYTEANLLQAFVEGARWAYDTYTEYAPMEGEDYAAAQVQSYRWLKVRQFDLKPRTVFMGTISYVPSRYNEPYAYSGPVLVGMKSDGTLTFSTTGGTVDITERTLEWRIDDVIFTPPTE